MALMFVIKNTVNGGYVRTLQYKNGDPGAIEVIYSGIESSIRLSNVSAARLFVQYITFNNDDNCKKDELEIQEFQIVNTIPC